MRVPPHPGQVQRRQLPHSGDQLHDVSFQGFGDDVCDSVELPHAEQRRALQGFRSRLALRHAARDDDRFPPCLGLSHELLDGCLRGPLDRAGVDYPGVRGGGRGFVFGFVFVAVASTVGAVADPDLEARLLEDPGHRLAVRDVMGAAKGAKPDARGGGGEPAEAGAVELERASRGREGVVGGSGGGVVGRQSRSGRSTAGAAESDEACSAAADPATAAAASARARVSSPKEFRIGGERDVLEVFHGLKSKTTKKKESEK